MKRNTGTRFISIFSLIMVLVATFRLHAHSADDLLPDLKIELAHDK